MAEEKTDLQKAPILANGRGLVLRNLTDMFRFAQYVVASRLAPRSFTTPEQIIIAIQSGAELGMPPMRSLQSFCVINGAARLYGDAPLALVRQSGLLEYIKEHIDGKGDDRVAVCETKRKEDPESLIRKFSVADAKVAGLWQKRGKQGQDTPWITYPERMLQFKARSLNLRDNFPDAFGGATIAEEYEAVVMPEDMPTPQVPARDQRKQIDAEVKDTQQVIEGELQKFFDAFLAKVEDEGNVILSAYGTGKVKEVLAQYAAVVIQDEKDYSQPENYTLENIELLISSLQHPLPQEILDILPRPLDGKAPNTEAEKLQEAEDRLDQKLKEYKYKCNNDNCGELFDEPLKKPKGVKLCPKCLGTNIVEYDLAKEVGE